MLVVRKSKAIPIITGETIIGFIVAFFNNSHKNVNSFRLANEHALAVPAVLEVNPNKISRLAG